MSRIGSRLYAARYKGYTRLFSKLMPYYVVNEFPKSGGTWLALMLADALQLPFRRNAPIRLEASIAHGHFLRPGGLHNVVVIWRDPRDVIVSLYHHSYFINEHANAGLVRQMKDRLPFPDYSDVSANLPAFIRFISTTPKSPRFTWTEFATVWGNRPGVVHVTYEELRRETPTTLRRVVATLAAQDLPTETAEAIAAQHDFARVKAASQPAPNSNVEVSFVREGAVGGWRRHFSAAAQEAFAEHFGDLPIALGYR